MIIDPGLMFKIVVCNPAPFNSTRGALAWARENGVIGRMSSDETGGKGVVNISADSIRESLNPRQREKSVSDPIHFSAITLKRYSQTGTSKAYAYRVNEIEVLPGTLGGRPKLATNPTGSTSICAAILLQGAVDVNGDPLLASAMEKKGGRK